MPHIFIYFIHSSICGTPTCCAAASTADIPKDVGSWPVLLLALPSCACVKQASKHECVVSIVDLTRNVGSWSVLLLALLQKLLALLMLLLVRLLVLLMLLHMLLLLLLLLLHS